MRKSTDGGNSFDETREAARLQRVRRRLDQRGRPQAGGRAAVLAALFRERVPGAREEVWRANDPRPFVVESWNWVRRR